MPVSGNSIQKIVTVNDIIERVLSRMGISAPDAVEGNIKAKILNEINSQQKNIFIKLLAEDENAKAQYNTPATFSFVSGEQTFETIETTNPLIYEVQRLEAIEGSSRVYGTVPYIDPVGFRNLNALVYFDNSILYTVETRRIKIFTGQNFNSTGFIYKLYYIREVNTLALLNDYVDLPSTKYDELVNNIVNVIQPQQQQAKETK